MTAATQHWSLQSRARCLVGFSFEPSRVILKRAPSMWRGRRGTRKQVIGDSDSDGETRSQKRVWYKRRQEERQADGGSIDDEEPNERHDGRSEVGLCCRQPSHGVLPRSGTRKLGWNRSCEGFNTSSLWTLRILKATTQNKRNVTQYRRNVTQYRLNVTQYRRNVTQYRLNVTQYRRSVTKYRPNFTQYIRNVTQYRLNVTQYRRNVTQYRRNVTQYRLNGTQYRRNVTQQTNCSSCSFSRRGALRSTSALP